MSGEILLKAADARGAAKDVTGAAQDALDSFNTLKSRLAPLADCFRGKAATAWDARYDEWDKSAKDLMDALDGLGKFLNGAADAIEGADDQLASQLA
jgi:WXG100 family type VII secretion target